MSIQIIDKTKGYRVVHTVGSASDLDEVERLWQKGLQIVHRPGKGQLKLISLKGKADLSIENFMEDLANANIRTIGPELLFWPNE